MNGYFLALQVGICVVYKEEHTIIIEHIDDGLCFLVRQKQGEDVLLGVRFDRQVEDGVAPPVPQTDGGTVLQEEDGEILIADHHGQVQGGLRNK